MCIPTKVGSREEFLLKPPLDKLTHPSVDLLMLSRRFLTTLP
jgi:hypothetical protein